MVNPGVDFMYSWARSTLRDLFGGTAQVAELQGLTANDLLQYGLLTVPLLVGLYYVMTKHKRRDVLCFSWLFSLFVLGLFAKRMFLYATPAACVICGIGLASMLDCESSSRNPTVLGSGGSTVVLPSGRFMKMSVAFPFLLILLLVSPYAAYNIGSGDRLAANRDWQAALSYLKDDTPDDSVVISWWDYGYWILDMAERKPLVDNGSWDEPRLEDIGLAYCTTDPSEAAMVMQKYEDFGGGHHPVYLVFSRVEGTLFAIPRYGLGEARENDLVPNDLKDSLYYRSLHGTFRSGGGLKRVYPSVDVEQPQVVILALE
jgi:asparagine N-glycosylation enzyme membrane subunit Stt3